jgi:hypothetical protein
VEPIQNQQNFERQDLVRICCNFSPTSVLGAMELFLVNAKKLLSSTL